MPRALPVVVLFLAGGLVAGFLLGFAAGRASGEATTEPSSSEELRRREEAASGEAKLIGERLKEERERARVKAEREAASAAPDPAALAAAPNRRLAESLYRDGVSATTRADWEGCLDLTARSILADPGFPLAWRSWAICQAKRRDDRLARCGYLVYLKLDPAAPEGERLRAWLRDMEDAHGTAECGQRLPPDLARVAGLP
jgi:hypothetical protein